METKFTKGPWKATWRRIREARREGIQALYA